MVHALLAAAVLTSGSIGFAGDSTRPAPTEERMPLFGSSVAISGTQALVGEPVGRGEPGTVHLYSKGANGWRASGSLRSEASAPNDGFGAAIAVSANAAFIAAIDQPTQADSGRGSVFTFKRNARGAWDPAGRLFSYARSARGSFGAAMLIDGDVAYIGAPGEGPGAVHMYRRSADGTWTADGSLTVDSLETLERFGSSIALDGGRLVVGAPGRSTNKGAVYVFTRGPAGRWMQEARVMPARGSDNARFGSSVALKGTRLVSGSPGAVNIPGQGGGFVGTVSVFEYSEIAEIWRERQTFLPPQYASSRFGQTIAMAGDEIWAGAPAAERNTGRVFRMRTNREGDWLGVNALEVAGVEPGALFGQAIAVNGSDAAIGMPGDAGQSGSVMFLARNAAGTWVSRGVLFPATTQKTFAAMRGKETMCDDANGKAGEFECSSTSIASFLPISAIGGKRGTSMNDNWGWTDTATDREIAILGRTDGTSFVDVSNPSSPRYLGDLPKTRGAPSSAWRDMKIYKDHVFIVSDNAGEHGMQVFDLTRLRGVTTAKTFTPDVVYDRINSAHNIVSNEETGFMYIVGASGGGETCGGGYHMVDVRDPKKPKFAGCYGDPRTGRAGTGYSHDAQCVKYSGPDSRYTGKEVCIGSNETAISIADLSDKKNPVAISRASYPDVAYAHQAWLTDDHKYLYLNDEGDESSGKGEAAKGTRTLVWDLTDLTDPILVKEHVGVSKAIDHNLYVKGDRMYQANYTSGMRILDISDPRNPKEVGYIDTFPGDDGTPSFSGAWSVYPYFKSGTIIVTSIGEGVFFVKDRTKKTVQ